MSISANAHSILITSYPKNGATVTSSLKKITLKFNEKVLVIKGEKLTTLTLKNDSGIEVSISKPVVEAETVSATIGKKLNNGNYSLNYRVISQDGHVMSDQIKFKVKGN